MNLDIDLTSVTKINSKWIIVVYVKCKTIRFLKKKNRKIWMTLGLATTFQI